MSLITLLTSCLSQPFSSSHWQDSIKWPTHLAGWAGIEFLVSIAPLVNHLHHNADKRIPEMGNELLASEKYNMKWKLTNLIGKENCWQKILWYKYYLSRSKNLANIVRHHIMAPLSRQCYLFKLQCWVVTGEGGLNWSLVYKLEISRLLILCVMCENCLELRRNRDSSAGTVERTSCQTRTPTLRQRQEAGLANQSSHWFRSPGCTASSVPAKNWSQSGENCRHRHKKCLTTRKDWRYNHF